MYNKNDIIFCIHCYLSLPPTSCVRNKLKMNTIVNNIRIIDNMMYVLEIQSSAQHLYNCLKSAIDMEIIDSYHFGEFDDSVSYDLMHKCYIDRLYDEFSVFSLHYHRYGECIDVISDVQINMINWDGVCSGCNENISNVIKQEFLNHHDLYEIARDVGNISIYDYIPGSTTCILVIQVENPYLFNVLCDDLMNIFLTTIIYHLDEDTIYKSTITSVPIVYTILPDLKTWKFDNNDNNDIVTRLLREEENDFLHEVEIANILKPGYKDELYTFVNRYVDAVYTIQNAWRESRYNPEGGLCKKWCTEIQAKWNKANNCL